MDLLKAELARKRKELEDKKLVGPEKKYFKRGELKKKEAEEFIQKIGSTLKHPEVYTEKESLEENDQPTSQNVDEKILPRKEVIKRLRDRGEPILLFGETLTDAFHRLKALEIAEPENIRGLRNDFQAAMEQVGQQYLNELLKSQTSNQDKDKLNANDVKVEEMNTTVEEIKNLAVNLGRKKDNIKQDCNIICTFLKFLLELWGKQLNDRCEVDKTSAQGKIESVTYTQTQAYLKPLFKQLKHNKVADDILRHLMHITKHLLERDYVKANDNYLQMAIGNSPWPIGVTMVGIHARTGREKIFSQNIAHVLNDETQRKYIQGLKRLITRCQKFFPANPSKCVEYNA